MPVAARALAITPTVFLSNEAISRKDASAAAERFTGKDAWPSLVGARMTVAQKAAVRGRGTECKDAEGGRQEEAVKEREGRADTGQRAVFH
jgi:hypothetical protein